MLSNQHYYIQSFDQMIQEIKAEVKATSYSTGIRRLSDKVISALEKIPRQLFVGPGETAYAYVNEALPIGENQTISQPFIVAIMTELLHVQPNDKVLEIGTGSGYQAALLSKLAAVVYTVEIFPRLARLARARFQSFKYHNIHIQIGNGYGGWIENAPYNKIIVTASIKHVPQPLIDQLSINGIMVIPIGKQGKTQSLTVIKKDAKGHITQKEVLDVAFVPFL